MSHVATRLRRQYGDLPSNDSSRQSVSRPARSDKNREPVSARLRRIQGPKRKVSQEQLPGFHSYRRPATGLCAPAQEDSIDVEHRVVTNRLGGYVRGHAQLPGSVLHGALPLSSSMRLDGEAALLLSGDVALADFRPERALFFDLETTGLPRGARGGSSPDSWQRRGATGAAGTPLAFLIGALQLSSYGRVTIHQFLLRQQPDETAQLSDFSRLLGEVDYLVSFNGRSFDRNILADRLIRNRMDPERILSLPHLDLLHPSARLYRQAFGGSSLAVLERRVLGVQRPTGEVSGAEVPQRWTRYLRTGDPRLLYAVLDHNVLDLLSMVTLSGHLARALRAPGLCLAEPSMLAGAARLLMHRGQHGRAETLLRRLTSGSSHDPVVYTSLARLSEHLRKTGRHGEAMLLWERMIEEKGISDLAPWRAAAIALERRLGKPRQALDLVLEVLERIERREQRVGAGADTSDFIRRKERLERVLRRSIGKPKNAA